MKKLLTLLILFLLPSLGFTQKIYVTKKRSEANKIVYRTKMFSEANLVVKITTDHNELKKPYHWYMMDDSLGSDMIIFYTKNPKEADICILFTDRKGLWGTYRHSELCKCK